MLAQQLLVTSRGDDADLPPSGPGTTWRTPAHDASRAATCGLVVEASDDVPATIKLLGSGLKHLAKVRRKQRQPSLRLRLSAGHELPPPSLTVAD